jgi:hypothetical protein
MKNEKRTVIARQNAEAIYGLAALLFLFKGLRVKPAMTTKNH